jgi:protein subunit release factor B
MDEKLDKKMLRLGVRQEDIVEKFVHARGPGGQNVNKVATCVQLIHLPSGIEVKCQQERSQFQNRLRAKELLLDKIEKLNLARLANEKKKAAKIRRQKRKRSLAVKERMLEAKRRRGFKKLLRSKVRESDD